MKKKILTMLLAAVTVIGMLAGCGAKKTDSAPEQTDSAPEQTGEEDAPPAAEELATLRVQSMPNFNGVLLSYIVDQGWAAEEGLNLEVELYANGAAANEALGAELWDVGFQGPAYVFGAVNNEAKIIGTSSNTGGDRLFVRGDSRILDNKGSNPTYPEVYGTAEDLKGVTILYTAGTSTHQLALSYLEAMGLSADDVKMVPMDYQTCVQTFALGEGDVVALPTPWSTEVTDEYGWQQVAELVDFCSTNTDVICSADAYENMKPELVKFLKLCYRAADELEGDLNLKKEQMKKFYKENALEVTDETIDQEAELRVFVTSEEQKTMEYGTAEYAAADFYAQIGQIEAKQAEEFKTNLVKADLWEEALK